MNSLIGGVLLQAQPGLLDMLVPLGMVFLIFYLLVIRPEGQKRKQLEATIASAEKGDEIVTTGGLEGLITGSTDDVVTVEIAVLKNGERVRVKMQRSAIASVTKGGENKGGDS